MPWAGELSDEELSIIKAAFQTIQVQGTPVMRKVVALEDRLVAESQQKKEVLDGTREARQDAHEDLSRLQGEGQSACEAEVTHGVSRTFHAAG